MTQIERLQFTYYDSKEEGCYFSHVDPLEWKNPYNRKLSLVVQLSDPSEYEGGELQIHTGQIHTVEKKHGKPRTTHHRYSYRKLRQGQG